MKKTTLFNVAIASAAGVAMLAAGCARTSNNSTVSQGSDVKSVAVESELLSISKTYPGYDGEDSCALTLKAFIDYPTKIGAEDITPLQEAIKDAVFDNRSGAQIDAVMDSFVTETASYGLNVDPNITGVPSKLKEECNYYADIQLHRRELGDKMVTYSLVDSRFMGGGHPMTYTRSFTYAFEAKEVLTLENMFNPDKMDIVFSAVNQALAQQYGVESGNLTAAGFYQNAVGVPSLLSVENGMIVFHYNPYDVAPYSQGAINVEVAPIMIEEAMSPMAKKLFF